MALILSQNEVKQCVSMVDAIAAMRTAFQALAEGHALISQRSAAPLIGDGVALLMPSLLRTQTPPSFVVKCITVVPENFSRQLPLTSATMLLLDAETGQTLAVLSAGWPTAMRTGAVSGLATDLMARPDADILALFGAGGQAPFQAVAIHAVRPLREIRIVNRNPDHFNRCCQTIQALIGPGCPPIKHVALSAEALRGASLVACATTASSPLFAASEVEPGTHINAIGAFTPEMCELDAELLQQARIVVDQREAALAEAGDLLQALARDLIPAADTWTELGELLTGQSLTRLQPEDITVFKSVGLAVQDAAIAQLIYQRAREQNLGVNVEL